MVLAVSFRGAPWGPPWPVSEAFPERVPPAPEFRRGKYLDDREKGRLNQHILGLCRDINLVGGIPTPLKNDGVRQLG